MSFPKLDTLLLGNQFIGIELFSLNSEEGIAIVFVEKKKDELSIVSKEKRSNFNLLNKKPNNDFPVFLVINNTHVIQKEVDSTDSVDSKLLYKAFPNIKTEDFHYEIWRLESQSIVAICRKSYIEDTIKDFIEKGITLSSFSIGVCGISHIKDFTSNVTLKTNNQTIALDNNDTILTSNENNLVKTFDINGLEVENTYLLAFTSIIQKVLKSNKTTGSIITYNSSLFENYKQSSFFKKGLKLTVYFLLSILLINFFLFNYYFKKSNETGLNVSVNKTLIEKIKLTKERLKSKEEKLLDYNNVSDSKSSFLINELAKNLPNSIILNELIYHPIEKKIKDDELIIFQSDVILISGTTINSRELTNWFEEIGKKKWVKNTTILHFGKNENNESVFTIRLNLK